MGKCLRRQYVDGVRSGLGGVGDIEFVRRSLGARLAALGRKAA